jgi:hypothetical protein
MRDKSIEQITLHILLHRAPVHRRHEFGMEFCRRRARFVVKRPASIAAETLRNSLIKGAISQRVFELFPQSPACFRQTRVNVPVRLDRVQKQGVETPFWREFPLLAR